MRTQLFLSVVLGTFTALPIHAAIEGPGTFPLPVKVIDSDGRPVPGASIEQYTFNYRIPFQEQMEAEAQVTSDANGTVELRASMGQTLLVARKPGLAPAWRQFQAVPGSPQQLMLTKPAVLAGIVVDESDKAVSNADISVAMALSETMQEGGQRFYNYISGKQARELFSARTGADGRFRMQNFPTNASAELLVLVPGKAVRSERRDHIGPGSLTARAGQEDLRLVVEPTGSIEGRIVTENNSQPVPIADLRLQPQGPFHFAIAQREPDRSQPDGTFRLNDVPAGTYRLMPVFGTNIPPEWVAEGASVTVEKGEVSREVALTAIRGGLLEVLLVSRGDRKPIEGVNVNAYQQNGAGAAISGTNGLARLRLVPGEYQVATFSTGRRTENSSVTVEAGQTNRLEFELAPSPKIRGIVRLPDGKPAPGLPIRIVGDHSMQEASIKTGPDGTFETEWSPQRFGNQQQTFCLLVRDAERNLAVAEDIDEDTGALDLKLAPGMSLAGRAEWEGKPITNVTAALVFWTGNSGMHLNGLGLKTNQPGHFEIPALPPGRKYGLYVSAPGFGQQYVNLSENEDEAKRVEVDPISLKVANLKLSGKVLNAEEKPVAGAYVHMSGEGQPNGNTMTDRDGQFRFENVCEGSVRLFANANNSHGNGVAEGGDTNVVITLGEMFANAMPNAKPRKIKGMVTGPDNKPIAGAQVTLMPNYMSVNTKTGTNGEFNLNWRVEPWQAQMGDPLLVVRDAQKNLAAAEDLFEDTTNVTVQLKPALTVTGRVLRSDGTPLSNASVGIWMQVGRNRSSIDQQVASADAAGKFKIPALPNGQAYTAYAFAKGFGQSQQPVFTEAETNHIELEPFTLKVADQVIAGQVLNPNDKPAAGIHISYSGDDQPHGSTTADSKGRFKIQICEGSIRLFAGNEVGHANMSVESGDTNVILQLQSPDMARNRGGGARRPTLNGKTLDLSSVGLPANTVSPGKLTLVCLVDVDQRPSRRLLRSLAEEQELQTYPDLTYVAVHAKLSSPEPVESWKRENPGSFPIGRVAEKNEQTKWAHAVDTLPWLILIDSKGRVAAEGFEFEQLEVKLEEARPTGAKE